MSSVTNIEKSNLSTPLRLTKRKHQQAAPPETPECYTKVTVETPRPCKSRSSKEKCDEIRNLTVAVRIRPMNIREQSYVGAKNIIKTENDTIKVISLPSVYSTAITSLTYTFQYDHVFYSSDETNLNYSSQQDVFVGIGQPLLSNAFRGFNGCLFAYGQTGSGKSYSMMGPSEDSIDCNHNAGIIPRFCQELFTRINQLDSTCTAAVDVSYFEIYNEKIHDLLLSNSSNHQRIPLKVREHPTWGPYVVNLSTHTVKSYEEIRSWLLLGNRNRATAATAMNEKSSRSHSIFSIELSLSNLKDSDSGRRSKVNLVDLAGSERLGNSSSNDEKHKQGVSINKSLLTLGKVICALSEQKKAEKFIPYRESVLTWLLRESLGGNSLTFMLATITPASTNVDETLSTLRYACQARSIVNRAHINEDPHDRLIRELRSEVERLQALRQEYERHSFSSSSLQIDNSTEHEQEIEDLRSKLLEKEEMLKLAQQSWENRYKETHEHQMQQLAEVEKKKEELESQVRIMHNLQKDDVNLSPYRTNFLEEVESVLKENSHTLKDLEILQRWFFEHGHDFEVTLKDSENFINILDKGNNQISICTLNQVKEAMVMKNIQNFVSHLKWNKREMKLTESQLKNSINIIYDTAGNLRPYTEQEEKLRLVFAKFIKATQALETALHNNINEEKPKKIVSFRF